jgi:hypothetical protein
MEVTEEALRAMFAVLSPHLDERQRRLLAGAQARALGRGGIAAVTRASGLSRATVKAGATEIDQGPERTTRIRRAGAGRPKATTHDPDLLAALDGLVEPTARGDPTSPLRWTCKSTRKLADELGAQGHRVSANTVAGLDYLCGGPPAMAVPTAIRPPRRRIATPRIKLSVREPLSKAAVTHAVRWPARRAALRASHSDSSQRSPLGPGGAGARAAEGPAVGRW